MGYCKDISGALYAVVFPTGVFSRIQEDWAAFCCPFLYCMSVSIGPHGLCYIYFLDTVLLDCINTLSMNDVARVLRLESSSAPNYI